MKTIISAEKEIFYKAALQIRDLLSIKPDAVLALCSGRSVAGLYSLLTEMYAEGKLSFKNARVFAVTELLEVPAHMSSQKLVFDDFLSKTDMQRENFFVPDFARPEKYDEQIEKAGGIDFALLGIGENAHIGYNEPATPFSSLTHVQKLTDRTKAQLSKQFAPVDTVPEKAVTMGIKTITQARDIHLIALGEDKAQAVHKMLYGRNDSAVPAAFLQIPLNVSIYLDEAASSQL